MCSCSTKRQASLVIETEAEEEGTEEEAAGAEVTEARAEVAGKCNGHILQGKS